MDTIKIKVEGCHTAPLEKFSIPHDIPSVKKHSLMELAKLEQLIVRDGLLAPFLVCFSNGKLEIMDGEARYSVISELKNRGFEIPQLPYVLVSVADRKEKENAMLSVQSQFHCIPESSLKLCKDVNLYDYQFLDVSILDLHEPLDLSLYFRDLQTGKFSKIKVDEKDYRGLL